LNDSKFKKKKGGKLLEENKFTIALSQVQHKSLKRGESEGDKQARGKRGGTAETKRKRKKGQFKGKGGSGEKL